MERSSKRNKYLDFGSDLDHHADCLKPQSPQATVCYKVGAAALVHLRPVMGGCTILPFKQKSGHYSTNYERILMKILGQLCNDTRLSFGVIGITMLALQIGKLGNMGVMSCLSQGGLHSLSALVHLII